jgi:SHS2 domain-containing protein
MSRADPSAGRSRRWGSFPTTADEGIWASGGSPPELFEALGMGLFALITDLRTVQPREERTVSARGADLSSLVVAYLTELLLLQQTEGFLAREVRVRLGGSPPTSITATARGEPLDAKRHPRRKEVKAVTFHGLVVDLGRGRARVIVDI